MLKTLKKKNDRYEVLKRIDESRRYSYEGQKCLGSGDVDLAMEYLKASMDSLQKAIDQRIAYLES